MNEPTTEQVLKRITQTLDLNFLSYVGYPPDDEVPYPEEFLHGYHKCIEDFINETQRLGFNSRVQRDKKTGEPCDGCSGGCQATT
jgi:hypothetical protein